jgi:hypothetical protein
MRMRLTASIILLLLPVAAAAQVYIWKDASGKTHYTDQPPPETNVPSRRLGPSFSASADAEAARKASADKRLDAAKKGKETQEKTAAAEKQRSEDEQRAKDCERAQTNLQGLESGQLRFRMGANGEREALDGSVRDAELENTRRAIENLCSPRPAPTAQTAAKK